MSSCLVVSALGTDRPGIVTDLTEAVLANGCNIEDSRMTVLGGEFAVIMLITGQWNSIAKLEGALPTLQEQLQLTLTARRTAERAPLTNAIPYTVEVVAIDHPGIVHDLAEFFSARNINIHDLFTGSYHAAHTGTRMFSLNMTVEIPGDTHIAGLRDQFMEFCDQLNLDAVIEPIKV
ncbi:MAG: glycine cleavage system protein R [Pseudomonadota bacterium]|nr:MAG: glycine cleavage system protein R [Pseudomonadota bacterium]